jgi:hypothetical protein
LGVGPAPDLLVVSLSANDLVGHAYGPRSHEAEDALARLDESLGDFLVALEKRVGKQRLFTVLTSDHGVLPLPEWLSQIGQATCPLEGGRQSSQALLADMQLKLNLRFERPDGVPGPWAFISGTGLRVNRELVTELGVDLSSVFTAIKEVLEESQAIERVWSDDDLFDSKSEIAKYYQRSLDPDRSPDLHVQLAAGCLIRGKPYGTSHGTPHAYDREIPLVFMGPGVEPGAVKGPAFSVDIGPTLGRVLGLTLPDGLDGRVLDLGGAGRWKRAATSGGAESR